MSVLGKILALLNIVAALGFAYVAMLDYGRHKNWAVAIEKLDLQQQGVPTDEKETDLQGRVRVLDFDNYTLKALPKLDGQPLTSQEKAMHDVEKKVRRKVDAEPFQPQGLPNPLTTKTQRLAWALQPLATTFARRNALYHVMVGKEPTLLDGVGIFEHIEKGRDGKCAFDVELAPLLKKVDDEALPDKDEAEAKRRKIIADAIPTRLEKDFDEAFKVYTLPEQEKRLAFAHLMVCLCDVLREDEQPVPAMPESKAFANVVGIIGVRAASAQMSIQADILRRMWYECDLQIDRERDPFVQEHNAKLARIVVLKRQLRSLEKQNELKKTDVEKQEDLIRQQEAEVKRLEKELADARALTEKKLDDKGKKEETILNREARLHEALDKVQATAKELRQLEEKFPRREAEPR